MKLATGGTEMKIGDKVKCIDNNIRYETLTMDKVYEVVDVHNGGVISVVNDLGDIMTYFARRFEAVKFEFEDIQVGDKIRCTYSYSDESITINETREGVVTEITEDCVYADGRLLAVTSNHTTYELIERPEPKLQVPTELMSMIQHKVFRDAGKLVKVDNTDTSWLGYIGEGGIYRHTNKTVQDLLDTGDWEVVTNEDH